MAPVRLQSRSASSSFVCCRVRPTLLCDGKEDDALLVALFQSAMLQLWHPEPFHPIVLRFSQCLDTIPSSRPYMSNVAHPDPIELFIEAICARQRRAALLLPEPPTAWQRCERFPRS